MRHHPLGQTDLRVSEICLGTMTFGASSTYMKGVTAPDHEAKSILDAALEGGVNFIDTANSYSQGLTETLLGDWLKGRRDEVVLATKVGMVIPEDGVPGPAIPAGLHPNLIRASCEASLKRLKTDRIDLFQLHMQDTEIPIEDSLGACADLINSGKVRYIGCANYTGYRLAEAMAAADKHGLPRFQSLQMQWSLAVREGEREMAPAARNEGLSILTWSPLARGFLSGKIARDGLAPEGSRLSTWGSSLQALMSEQNFNVLDALRELAGVYNAPIPSIALAWLLKRQGVHSVIVGARTLSQLKDNFHGAKISLSDADLNRLDELSTPDWGYPYIFIAGFKGAGNW